MRRTQATNTLAAKVLRAALLAAILAGLAAPLLGPGGAPAPATALNEQAEWEQLIETSAPISSTFELPVEELDVETLRQIIQAPNSAASKP
ncbi:MAG TPA: hypothetical protein VFU22_13190 [Roseiflexaceae bacterium]|nr:hypothetical protein [Roseiflexaceae bacterium]